MLSHIESRRKRSRRKPLRLGRFGGWRPLGSPHAADEAACRARLSLTLGEIEESLDNGKGK
jgi:hypothetical protein